MRKRFLVGMLSFCLLMSMLPAAAVNADEGQGEDVAAACVRTEDCQALEHEEDCPLYEDADRESGELVENIPVDLAPSANSVAKDDITVDSVGAENDNFRESDSDGEAEYDDKESWENCTSCSAANPHIITTAADLNKIRTHVSADDTSVITGYFQLANDIEFKDSDFEENGDFYNDGYGWIAIGKDNGTSTSVSKYFSGVFDGGGYSIVNLTAINQTAYVGLFGQIGAANAKSGEVKNLTLKNFVFNEMHEIITGTMCGRTMGGVCADLYGTISNVVVDGCKFYAVRGNVGTITAGAIGGTIQDCVVRNSEVYGIATPDGGNNNGDKSGLICGYANKEAEISGCVVLDSKVTADSRGAAGIAGIQYGSSIMNCSVENCEITGKNDCVGGISGGNYTGGWSSSIENCTVSDCKIFGGKGVGGIEGNIGGGEISINLKNNVILDSSLALESANFDDAHAGGILGGIVASENITATIENCLAANVTLDSRNCYLNNDSVWPLRLGSICGGGVESLEISNVFADVEILSTVSQPVKIGGICTDQGTREQTDPIKLDSEPQNTYYVQYDGGPATDFPGSEETKYAVRKSDKTIQYGTQLSLTDVFKTQLLPDSDLVKYKSSDESVLTISGNDIVVHKTGEATITCCITINGIEYPYVSAVITVTPRILTYYNKDTKPQENPGSVTYAVSEEHQNINDLLTFKWKDSPNTEVTLADGADLDYTYTVPEDDGGLGREVTVDFLPMPKGEYTVRFNLKNPNYVFASSSPDGGSLESITLTANVTGEGVERAYIAEVESTGNSFTYDGTGKLPVTGTLTAYRADDPGSEVVDAGSFNLYIEGLNDTAFHSQAQNIKSGTSLSDIADLELPSMPGAYLLTVSAENENYYIYKSQVFTIEKATVTIKPNDRTAYVGDEVPVLGENDYTVTGLAEGDSLAASPVLAYENTPDMTAAGTYAITAEGAAVPNTECYEETIIYEPGTLTVTQRSGGDGEPGNGDSGSEDNSGGSDSGTDKDNNENTKSEQAVETGDSSNGSVWVLLSGVSLIVFGMILKRKRVK